MTADPANPDRGGCGREETGRKRREAGTRNDEDADEAQQDDDEPRRRQPLSQDEGREQRDPDRLAELQGKHLRKRSGGDREEPEVLAREVADIAREVPVHPPRADIAEPAKRAADANDQQDADYRPEEQDLEGVELDADRAPSDCHRGEADDGARHPRRRSEGPTFVHFLA